MEVVGRKKYSCKYPGCNNWYYVNVSAGFVNKHFFTFPKDAHQNQLWKDACEIDEVQNVEHWKICDDHFEASSFVNERKERLNTGSVPKLYEHSANGNFVLLEELPFSESVMQDETSVECSCHQATTSTAVCKCFDQKPSSHSQDCEIMGISSFDLQDHNYCRTGESEVLTNTGKFAFLEGNSKDSILSKIGLRQKELTPRKSTMYKARLVKLSKLLEKERSKVTILQNLYNEGKFEFIDENVNFVTKEFINSQLRNANVKPTARRWTEQDKAFALSLYKRSPRLYRYLQVYFQLPSSRSLKAILAKIPFDTGVNSVILEHLRSQISKMNQADSNCTLLFDEISLCQGFHYERVQQYLSGFEDIGHLGRTNKAANHALVFMVRGVRKQWKQVIAYYFTSKTIQTANLKFLIKEIISQLQGIELNVLATVCDQGPTNCAALRELCDQRHPRQSSYYFFVKDKPIVTIFDVPHLLKNTRNALLKCKIQFAPHKWARFHHIESVFNFDQQKTFKSLPKLKQPHFNLKNDSYMKMKVKVAAAQLSSSMASAMETLTTLGVLPAEAIFTAEFVQKVDDLFDSLNSGNSKPVDHKRFRCALSRNSPHLDFWKKLLTELNNWKLIDLDTDADLSNRYSFVRGWQTTIRSIIFLWDTLKDGNGFDYLNLRSFNQDPLENLFSSIRQHGAANTNPTCHQFTAALKTVVVNSLASPKGVDRNCEDDNCAPLDDCSLC
ncbi:unnamed protein product [Tenebrio molitor]|jgi:hypothetical protein|nr:unnamed protein product [Tenebrio molitor]